MVKKQTEQELLKVWRARLGRAKEVRREVDEKYWKKTLASYLGELKPEAWPKEDPWISVQKVFSAIRASLPNLLYSNPKFTLTPKKPLLMEDEQGQSVDMSYERAISQEIALNHTWGESVGSKHARVAILEAFLAYGVIKAGFSPEFCDDAKRGEFKYDENGDFLLGPGGLPILEKGEYLKDENGNVEFEEDGMPILHPGTLQRETFFIEAVHFRNMLHDPEGGPIFENHRWVAEEWVRPVKQVQADPNYRKKVRELVKGTEFTGKSGEDARRGLTISAARNDLDGFGQAVADDEERVRGYDIYDFETGEYLVLTDEVTGGTTQNQQFLRKEPIPKGIEHGPYRFLKFNETPNSWYPLPDAFPMAEVETQYNITASQEMRHREQAKNRYLEGPNAFREEEGGDGERLKFAHGPDNVLVKVNDPNAIRLADKGTLDGSHQMAIPQIRMDFAEVAAMPGEMAGVANSDTATQASIMQSNAEIRANDRRDNLVHTFLSEVGRMLLQSMQANAEMVFWAKLERPQDVPPFAFVEVSPKDLEGEFDIEVAIGSTMPRNSSHRLRLLIEMGTMISQNPQIAMSETYMKRLFEAADIRDKKLFEELKGIAQQFMQAQMQGGGGGAEGGQTQQVLQTALQSLFNSQGGAGTGAPVN